MTDRANEHSARPENRRWPMLAFRCPDPEERATLRHAAREAGLSMSEFVRQAVAERLAHTDSEVSHEGLTQ